MVRKIFLKRGCDVFFFLENQEPRFERKREGERLGDRERRKS
jgi:hypothetical protein